MLVDAWVFVRQEEDSERKKAAEKNVAGINRKDVKEERERERERECV